jgi:hypothetical protein
MDGQATKLVTESEKAAAEAVEVVRRGEELLEKTKVVARDIAERVRRAPG